MSTARNFNYKRRSTPVKSPRSGMIAAIQIEWKNLRRDLHGDQEALREERLIWITNFLGLKRHLNSITALTDGQLGLVLDELRRLTNAPRPSAQTAVAKVLPYGEGGAQIIHMSSEEQLFTIEKLLKFIGWTEIDKAKYLKPRFRATTERMLTHKQCNSFLMHLLNIAAHKDLKKLLGKDTKISRKMTAEHIPIIKKKLGIDQHGVAK